jgi:phytoene dehydrogenase-like protein
MAQYDAVIIGGGVAGLVAGNYLLDSGKTVLIVEQIKYPGGCACTFGKQGYKFDGAVHWISQAGDGGIVKSILREFGLDGEVRFERLPAPPRIWLADRKIEPSFGREGIIKSFSVAFPDESRKLDAFWSETEETLKQLWRLVKRQPSKMAPLEKLLFNLSFPFKFKKIAKYHKKKASDVIAENFSDARLRLALETMGIFSDISFVHYAWFNSVALEGDAYYPAGGIRAVPDALANRFVSRGGEIRYRCKAEKIIFADKKISGVIANGEEISADIVVSASDATKTFLNLIGEEKLPAEFVSGLKGWKVSEPFFYVYLGVDCDLRERGFDGTPIWYIPKNIDRTSLPMLGGKALGIGMPSLLERSLAPEGKSVVILGMAASCAFMDGCPVRAEAGANYRENEHYKAVKEKVGEYLIDLAEEAIPGLREKIELKIFATPHTFERYTGNLHGASSGWSMAADQQHKLSVKTPIPGLYLAGHWTMNPGGVPAAFVSGKLAAEEILKG